ncbi:uncharacterized protein V1518DRAFT_116137 [Limtongia smithiae]|uniref:uncharacterized protein n=1 Tax=Limtongia smithiae TaxID=1125753 RepID=UPI0034CE1B3F
MSTPPDTRLTHSASAAPIPTLSRPGTNNNSTTTTDSFASAPHTQQSQLLQPGNVSPQPNNTQISPPTPGSAYSPYSGPPGWLSSGTLQEFSRLFDNMGDDEDWEDIPATAIREMDASSAQLQLFRANATIRRLRLSLQKSNVISSQHHLQSRLLKIETEESMRRFHVENAIIKREVERLRFDLLIARQENDSDNYTRDDAERYRRRLLRATNRYFDAQRRVGEQQHAIDELKEKVRQLEKKDPQTQHARRSVASSSSEEHSLNTLGLLATHVLSQHEQDSSQESLVAVPGLHPERDHLPPAKSNSEAAHASGLAVQHASDGDSDSDVSNKIASSPVVGTFRSINRAHKPTDDSTSGSGGASTRAITTARATSPTTKRRRFSTTTDDTVTKKSRRRKNSQS